MYTSYERSVNAKKQLRDRYGKWIEMGGGVKWFEGFKSFFGKVVGINGDYVSVEGRAKPIHRSQIEAISAKADLDSTTGQGTPPQVATPVNDAPKNIDGWNQTGPQGGSNPGGTFTDEDGQEYYVKFTKSENHAKNEVLASRLYDLTGVATPSSELVERDGKIGVATPLVPDVKGRLDAHLNDKPYLDKIREGFATDAWVANWDVAGLEFDNVVTDGNGEPVRVDPGGALLYRAMGGEKGENFGDSVGEWDSLRTSTQGKRVFGDMSNEQARESAKNVVNVTDAQIDEVVDSVGFDDVTADLLKARLKARRDDISARSGVKAQLPDAAPADIKPGTQSATDFKADAAPSPEPPEAPAAPAEKFKSTPYASPTFQGQKFVPVTQEEIDAAPEGAVVFIRKSGSQTEFVRWDKVNQGRWHTYDNAKNPVNTWLKPDQFAKVYGEKIMFEGDYNKIFGGDKGETPTPTPEPVPETVSEKKFELLPDPGANGDGYHASGTWGKFGASGVMMRYVDPETDEEKFLLVQRGQALNSNKGKWQLPGGAMNGNENPYQGAARETHEELGLTEDQLAEMTPAGEVIFDNGKGWSYTNIAADVPEQYQVEVDKFETDNALWLTKDEILEMKNQGALVPSFANNVENIFAKFDENDNQPDVIQDPNATAPDELVVKENPKVWTAPGIPEGSLTKQELDDLPEGSVIDIDTGYNHLQAGKGKSGIWYHEGSGEELDLIQSPTIKYTLANSTSDEPVAEVDPEIGEEADSIDDLNGYVKGTIVHQPPNNPGEAPFELIKNKDNKWEVRDTEGTGGSLTVGEAELNELFADGQFIVGPYEAPETAVNEEATSTLTRVRELDALTPGTSIHVGEKQFVKVDSGRWNATWLPESASHKYFTSEAVVQASLFSGEDIKTDAPTPQSDAPPPLPLDFWTDAEPEPAPAPVSNIVPDFEEFKGYPVGTVVVHKASGTAEEKYYVKTGTGTWLSSDRDGESKSTFVINDGSFQSAIQAKNLSVHYKPEPGTEPSPAPAPADPLEEWELELLGLDSAPETDPAEVDKSDLITSTDTFDNYPVGTVVSYQEKGVPADFYVKVENGTWHTADKDGVSIGSATIQNGSFYGSINVEKLHLVSQPDQAETENKDASFPVMPEGEFGTDADGNQYISASDGSAIFVGSYVRSTADGQIGRVTLIQSNGKSVKIVTPDGDIKFRYASLVESATADDFDAQVPEGTTIGKKIDANGNEYLLDADGNALFVGSHVVSTKNPPLEGNVVAIMGDGIFVRVEDANGKKKMRRADKLRVTDGAPPQAALDTTAEDNTDTDVDAPAVGRDPGPTIISQEELKNLPVGSKVTTTALLQTSKTNPNLPKSHWEKVEDNRWAFYSDGVATGDIDSDSTFNGVQMTYAPETAAPSAPTPDPSGYYSTEQQVFTEKSLNDLPVGSQITTVKPQNAGDKNTSYWEKQPDGMWQYHLDGNPVTSPDDANFLSNLNGWIKAMGDEPQSMLPANGTDYTLDELNALPTGFKITTDSHLASYGEIGKPTPYWEKTASGHWQFFTNDGDDDGYEFSPDGAEWFFVPGSTLKPVPLPDDGPILTPQKTAPTSTPTFTPGSKIPSGTLIADLPVGLKFKLEGTDSIMEKLPNGNIKRTLADGTVSSVNVTQSSLQNLLNIQDHGLYVLDKDKYFVGDELDDTDLAKVPVGTVVTSPSLSESGGFTHYQKVGDNLWLPKYSDGSYSPDGRTDKQVALYSGDGMKVTDFTEVDYPQNPTWGQIGSSTVSASDLSQLPAGAELTLIHPVMWQGMGTVGVHFKDQDGYWYYRYDDGYVDLSEYKSDLGMEQVLSDGERWYVKINPNVVAPKTAVTGPKDKSGKTLSIGDVVNHPKKGHTGKIIEIIDENTVKVRLDSDGTKRVFRAKFLNQTLSAADANDLVVDVNSPWYGKPAPTLPEKPAELDTIWVPGSALYSIADGYKKVNPTKNWSTSSYNQYWDSLVKSGDLSLPPNPNETKYGPQIDRIDFFVKRGYLSEEEGASIREYVANQKAIRESLQASFDASMARYQADMGDWRLANGIGANFSVSTFVAHSTFDEGAYMPAGDDDGTSWADDNLSIPYSHFSVSAKDGIKGYTSGAFDTINTEARKAKNNKSQIPSHVQMHLTKVNQAFEEAPEIEDDFVVVRSGQFRNVVGPNGQDVENITEMKNLIGSVVVDYGVISSSAGTTPGYASHKPVWYRIRVPKGSKAIWVDGNNSYLSSNPGEREVVLPPGTHMLVHNVTPDMSGGGYYGGTKTYVDVEIVPNGWTPEIGAKNAKKYAGLTSGPINPDDIVSTSSDPNYIDPALVDPVGVGAPDVSPAIDVDVSAGPWV